MEAFLNFRKKVLEELGKSEVLRLADVHFAVVDTSGVLSREFQDLHSLSHITLLTTPEPMGADGALVFCLRLLRGTIREEDIVVAADPRLPTEEKWLRALLGPLVDEGYDSRKIVIWGDHKRSSHRNSYPFLRAVPFASFRGWFAQFQLKRAEFNAGFAEGLDSIELPKRIIPRSGTPLTQWWDDMRSLWALSLPSSRGGRISLPLLVGGLFALAAILRATTSEATEWLRSFLSL